MFSNLWRTSLQNPIEICLKYIPHLTENDLHVNFARITLTLLTAQKLLLVKRDSCQSRNEHLSNLTPSV